MMKRSPLFQGRVRQGIRALSSCTAGYGGKWRPTCSEVADWLEYTLKLLWSTYPAWAYADGAWHEGMSYWRSYMGRMIRVVTELEKLGIPLKDKPCFQNTGWFGLYAAHPNRPTNAFGDPGGITPLGRSHGELMYAIFRPYQNPYFRWHAEVSRLMRTII